MYTKEEWFVERNKTSVYAYDPIVPVFIADCGQHGNAEANAQLIASAPDLYEALKGANKYYCLPNKIQAMVDKALAKARL